ncbi:MAG: PDZ domain-containing protein, partial [Candidatus Marinimicrobia bacterium]|nr:PDZ domain-containing protein [Candidatus Neomarinimicrobiota bacterium]
MSVKQSLKSTALAFDALLFLFAVVGIWRTVDRSGLPHKVILHDNQVMVAELRSTGIEGPLQTGDQIRAVAGQQIHNLYDVDFLIDHVPIGDSVSLLVERAGQELAIDVDLVRYYNNRFIITQTAVGCIYFFIGLLVLIWKSGEMMAFLFHWSAIAVALMIMTAWGSYTISPPVLAYASQLVA